MTTTLTLFPHGWQHYLLGGLLIGTGVALLYVLTGRIGGMSTVFSSTWSYVVNRPFFQQPRFVDSRGWRLVYALGLVLGAAVWWLGLADAAPQSTGLPVWQLVLGGFFVGYGARLGNGCTSGHGICGLGSLQVPSLFAVLTFMATAFLTANLFARVMPGVPA
ncbi:MAG: YeeE/YedE family protein [Burkholderiales bacterium]|nr:YeeE/YedE family protein [Burkholderiales bacterium]